MSCLRVLIHPIIILQHFFYGSRYFSYLQREEDKKRNEKKENAKIEKRNRKYINIIFQYTFFN